MSVSKTETISQSPFLISETESFSNFFSESELSLRFSILVKGVIFTDFSFPSASLNEIESDVISVTCPIEKISLLQGSCLLPLFSGPFFTSEDKTSFTFSSSGPFFLGKRTFYRCWCG